MKVWTVCAALWWLAASPAAAEQTWIPAAPMPEAVQEIYGAVRDDVFYTAGGLDADGAATRAVRAYHAGTDTWRKLPPLPAPRHHVGVAVVGDVLYAVGGFAGPLPVWRAVDEVWALDPGADTWRAVAPLPAPRGEHVTAVVGGKIHVIGGRVPERGGADRFEAHRDTARMDIYDPATGQWSRGPDAPTARNSAGGAVIGERLLVVGGRRYDPGDRPEIDNLATLEIFDTVTGTWAAGAPMPQAQGGLAVATLDGHLFAIGGEAFSPAPQVFPDVWVYTPASDRWTRGPSMRTPRHGTAAAELGGDLYVFGGATTAGLGAVATVERLSSAP